MDDTTQTTLDASVRGPSAPPVRRWVTWRSAGLGTLMVCLVCGLTPYSDWVVANSPAIGSYLPLILILAFFALVILVNGPLHRFALRWALAPGELAVVMAMTLVACSIPTQELMRNVLPMLVAPFHHAGPDPRFWQVFSGLQLPGWLFPVEDLAEGRTSPIVQDFYGRVQAGEPIPHGAWVIPLAGWGVFFAGLLGSLLALSVLVRGQWSVNERLGFPLAQLQTAMIEAPRPGRAFNDLLACRTWALGFSWQRGCRWRRCGGCRGRCCRWATCCAIFGTFRPPGSAFSWAGCAKCSWCALEERAPTRRLALPQ